MIYLDNAATSNPKPGEVLHRALDRYLELGASPGRGGYDAAIEAEEEVQRVRRKLAQFFGGDEAHHICFGYNSTDALNTIIQGTVKRGDHVVSSRLEHNSVLRPLHHMKAAGWVDYDLVPFDDGGFVKPEWVASAIKPNTRLVVLTHASNVIGTIQPIGEIGRICEEKGVPLVVDASQTAGVVPIKAREWGVSGLAFTGHKSLLAPTGIGGMMLAPGFDPEPTRFGGTGVESKSPEHTLTYPNRLEAGTINLFGVIALGMTVDYIHRELRGTYEREMRLLTRLRDGLAKIRGVHLLYADSLERHVPVISCVVEGHNSADVGVILDGDYGIAVRTGLHCSPRVHEDISTADGGAIRFSLGPFNKKEDIDAAIRAMSEIAKS